MSRMDAKSPRISNSGRPSPRKLPLFSPSDVSPFRYWGVRDIHHQSLQLINFSFNEDSMKILNTDLEKQNGLIPCEFKADK